MIEVKNLTKRYGSKPAVDDISFTVSDGEILGFLGPNGAGKSTTMNIITGYIGATSGTVTIDGNEILENPAAAKSGIGYLPEHPPLYLDMTVKEYLSFMFDLKKVKLQKKAHLDEVCALVGISHVFERMTKNLSKGYRQRVGIAQALLGNPGVLILDEPTVGLDPGQIIEIRNLIRDLGKKHTVILSSHILSEVQATCERVIVINKGKLIADDSPDNLSRAMSSDHRLTVRVDGPEAEVAKLLSKLPDMVKVDKLGAREQTPGEHDGNVREYLLEAEPGADIRREMFKRLAERGWPILGLRSSELSLEDIFLQLTGDSGSAASLLADDAAASAEPDKDGEDAAAEPDSGGEAEDNGESTDGGNEE